VEQMIVRLLHVHFGIDQDIVEGHGQYFNSARRQFEMFSASFGRVVDIMPGNRISALLKCDVEL